MSGDQVQIPGEWVWTTIGELTYHSVDQGVPEGVFPYIEISSIDNATKKIVRANKFSQNSAPTRARQRLRAGDVLVSMTRPNLNAVALVPPSLHGAIGSTGFDVLRSVIVPSKWLFYAVQQQDFIYEMSRRVLGVVYPAIRPKDIRSFPIPLPPLDEQLRIVEEIEKQFTRLDVSELLLKRTLTNVRNYRSALLTSACIGRLVPDDEDQPSKKGRSCTPSSADRSKKPGDRDTSGLPDLPNDWAWVSLRDLASSEPNSITDGPFGSNLKTSHYTEDGPRVVRLQNVGDGEFIDEKAHISPEHYSKLVKHKVEAGDLVIAMLGEKLPRACVVPEWLGPAIVKADCARVSVNKDLVLPRYLNIALNCETTRARTSALVHGVGRPRLNLREIKEILIPLPPLAEQERICLEVDRQLSILGKIQAVVESSLKRAEFLRKGVLQRAFQGTLVPRMSTPETAGALLARVQLERKSLLHRIEVKSEKRPMESAVESRTMRSLVDALRQAGSALSPEELFRAAGFSPKSVDSIDIFYEELKVGVDSGLIVEEREAATVKLRAVDHEIG